MEGLDPWLSPDALARRVSAGVATGAEEVWVRSRDEVEHDYPAPVEYAYSTISGRLASRWEEGARLYALPGRDPSREQP